MLTQGRGRGRFRAGRILGKDHELLVEEPPPLFPPLIQKPLTLISSKSDLHKILKYGEICENLNLSVYYSNKTDNSIHFKVVKYSDRFMKELLCHKNLQNFCEKTGLFRWFPCELKAQGTESKNKKARLENKEILSQLSGLQDSVDGVEGGEEDLKGESGSEEPPSEDGMAEEEDNDYLETYFDNGEGLSEPDSGLDEATFV
jgi:DNA-directed RNA polymerase III subunit RPC7